MSLASSLGIFVKGLTRFAAILPGLSSLAAFVTECGMRINHR